MDIRLLAYTKRPELKTLLEFECRQNSSVSLTVLDDAAATVPQIMGLRSTDLLLLDFPVDGDEFDVLHGTAVLNKSGLGKVFILSQKNSNEKSFVSFPPNAGGDFLTKLRDYFPSETDGSDYISIPIDSFSHFKILPFDLFIKVGDRKFVKRIRSSEDIDAETIRGFREKGITDLYFQREHNREFSRLLINNMINKVETEYSSAEEKAKATSEVFLTAKEIVQSVGLPPKVVEVCESVMESITADVQKGKDRFTSYLSGVSGNTGLNFQFRFIQLSSFIATQIVEGLKGVDQAEAVRTIVFSAFFCDISLKDSDLLWITTKEDLEGLFQEDKKIVSEHALKASEIVSNYRNPPPEAARVIKQHHGAVSGIGFPEVCESEVHPLAKCLLAAHELALALLRSEGRPPAEVVEEAVNRFSGTPVGSAMRFFQSYGLGKA